MSPNTLPLSNGSRLDFLFVRIPFMKTKSTPIMAVVSKEGVRKYSESRVSALGKPTTSSEILSQVSPPRSPPFSSQCHPIHFTNDSFLTFTAQQTSKTAIAQQHLKNYEKQLARVNNISCKIYLHLQSRISRLHNTSSVIKINSNIANSAFKSEPPLLPCCKEKERLRQDFDRNRQADLAPFLCNPLINPSYYKQHIHA